LVSAGGSDCACPSYDLPFEGELLLLCEWIQEVGGGLFIIKTKIDR